MKIKFRAWDGEKIVHPEYLDRDGVAWWKEDSIPTTSKIVMLFTGLTDKNGKDIYEGDLVMVYGEIRKVEFKNAFWRFENFISEGAVGGFGTPVEAGHKPLYRYRDIEVVGNIYESPKLLKKIKKNNL